MKLPADFMADEDFQILSAIADKLVEERKIFSINLDNGARLTNIGQEKQFSWAGIDMIKDQYAKVQAIAPDNQKYVLVMPTQDFKEKVMIGEIFGMKVWADPDCPEGQFMIKPVL